MRWRDADQAQASEAVGCKRGGYEKQHAQRRLAEAPARNKAVPSQLSAAAAAPLDERLQEHAASSDAMRRGTRGGGGRGAKESGPLAAGCLAECRCNRPKPQHGLYKLR